MVCINFSTSAPLSPEAQVRSEKILYCLEIVERIAVAAAVISFFTVCAIGGCALAGIVPHAAFSYSVIGCLSSFFIIKIINLCLDHVEKPLPIKRIMLGYNRRHPFPD